MFLRFKPLCLSSFLCYSATVISLCMYVNAGDDEQSDFYCEPDYPCADDMMAASMIAGARSRFKSEHYRYFPSDSYLSRLHYDVCNLVSPSQRNNYKSRYKILVCIAGVGDLVMVVVVLR